MGATMTRATMTRATMTRATMTRAIMTRVVISLFAVSILNLLAACAFSQSIDITSPRWDSIIVGDCIDVRIQVEAARNKPVTAELDGQAVAVTGHGEYRAIKLNNVPPGVHRLTARCGGVEANCLVTTISKLQALKPQRVYLNWTTQAEAKLKKTLKDTLNTHLPDSEWNDHVRDVQQRVVEVVERVYLDFNLELVDHDDSQYHMLEFLSVNDGAYGRHLPAGGGNVEAQYASIHIGTFHEAMRTPARLSRWSPMSKFDPPDERCVDLGEAIGRTAAHELGHIFRLVYLDWMDHENGHNPPFAEDLTGAVRFRRGRFIMDSDTSAALPIWRHARIAAASATQREPRLPATFNNFNRSYLLQLLPR